VAICIGRRGVLRLRRFDSLGPFILIGTLKSNRCQNQTWHCQAGMCGCCSLKSTMQTLNLIYWFQCALSEARAVRHASVMVWLWQVASAAICTRYDSLEFLEGTSSTSNILKVWLSAMLSSEAICRCDNWPDNVRIFIQQNRKAMCLKLTHRWICCSS